MAATVLIREKNTVSQTATDKTSGTIRFKKADDMNPDLNNPLVVPTSLTEYSYEKWLRMHISAGTFTQVSNLRTYTAGSNPYGTGVKLWFKTIATFATPVIPSTSNDPPTHSTAFTDAFTYTSGAPLDMDDLNAGPFDSTALPKDIGNYLIAVMEVEIGASQGVKSAATLTASWDEI